MPKGKLRIVYRNGVPGIHLTIKIKEYRDSVEETYTFLIMEGVRWDEWKEGLFEIFCELNEIELHPKTMDRIYQIFSTQYPKINLVKYSKESLILAHIYYALNRVLIKETLYKARLEVLASNLHWMHEYNLIGESPQEIFDNIPIKVLRALNTQQGLRLIDTEEKRLHLCETYNRYVKVISGICNLTLIQWRYLLNKYYKGGEPNLKTLRYLKNIHTDSEAATLLTYQKRVSEIGKYYKMPLLPDNTYSQINNPYYIAQKVHEVAVEDKDYYNWHLYKRYKEAGYLLEGGEKYKVYFPRTVKEILQESEKQHNCLWRYASEVAEGNKIVFFVKDSKNGKTVADVELSENLEILQALGKYNKALSDELYQWISDYVEEKVRQHRRELLQLFKK